VKQNSTYIRFFLLLVFSATMFAEPAQTGDAPFDWESFIDSRTDEIYDQVVQWRRHFHQYPELSNREFKTAAKIAEFLESLGLEVQTGIAHTGVVGILRGGKPGPVVGLRADMDALPVRERVDLPFASEVVGEYMGREVPVMHACGHDAHMAMLMGVAQILTEKKEELPGTVKFIFQPAEEGTPPGEEGGAELMVKEGVLKNPDVEVIFAQHITAMSPSGRIGTRPGSFKAASDTFKIEVRGKQTHGSTPWTGVDPIVVSAQIINGLQTIVSRNAELTKEPAVLTVGTINAGSRHNIIPESAEMTGTIRTLDPGMRDLIHQDIHRVATGIAESMRAEAIVEITPGYLMTYNDPDLAAKMIPTLQEVAGDENFHIMTPVMGAEDFSFFQQEIPGLYYFLGAMPDGIDPADAPPLHTPEFRIKEEAMKTGVRAMAYLTIDYMNQNDTY